MKTYTCFPLFLFSIITLHATAQQGFQKLYGGHNQDKGFSSVSIFDGIYLLSSTTSSGVGLEDLALLNLDYSGNVNWAKTYGGAFTEGPNCMVGTGDGGLAIVGSSTSFNVNQNKELVFFKTNSTGNIVWEKLFSSTTRIEPATVIRTSDNGFAMTGLSVVNGFMHVILIRTNAAGDTLFTCLYGSNIAHDLGVGVVQTPDGGFVIAGKTLTNTNSLADMMLIKTDASGNMMWAKSYGMGAWEEAEAITITHDGNYLMCGSTTSYGQGSYDILLWKCDTAGNYLWGKTYGGVNSDASYFVHENADASIVVSGYTNSMGYGHPLGQDPLPTMRGDDSTNIFLMKTDAVGDTIWTESYGGNMQDEAFQFSLTPDGGYIIPGFSDSYTNSTDSMQMLLIRTDSLGFSGCHDQRAHPVVGTAIYNPQTLPFIQSRGMTVNNVNLTALPWNVAADNACLYIGIPSPLAVNEPILSVFPNPTNGEIRIKSSFSMTNIQITNILGQSIYQATPNTEEFSLQLTSEGTYFITISSDKEIATSKVIVIK
jgi:hypothetical protein